MMSYSRPHAPLPGILATLTATLAITSCAKHAASPELHRDKLTALADSISKVCADYPAQIGVAAIFNDRDTVTVNNRNIYPLMSVFKMHQALAIAENFDRHGRSLDSVLSFSRESLDPNTWSPMLKKHPEENISLSVKELLNYNLSMSDNNASNLMFDRLVSIHTTDSLIATIIPRSAFRLKYTEHEMAADHAKAYANSSTPLGAAMLINRLFTDSLVSPEKQGFITRTLEECVTGKDRIAAPLSGKEGVRIAHKTGSGYSDNGILAAHNDVAYISLPDSSHYSLAVLVKDFKGNEKQAADAIARISEIIYNFASGY